MQNDGSRYKSKLIYEIKKKNKKFKGLFKTGGNREIERAMRLITLVRIYTYYNNTPKNLFEKSYDTNSPT